MCIAACFFFVNVRSVQFDADDVTARILLRDDKAESGNISERVIKLIKQKAL